MKKNVTAAELLARLNADPNWVSNRAREEQERQRRAMESRQAEAPLVEQLRAVGVEVNSVWDLVNSSRSYAAAMPVLLDHFRQAYPASIREGIARALAVPAAVVEWKRLVNLYQEEADSRVRSGLAVAVAAAASDERIDDVIALVRDIRNGPSRLLLLNVLERSSVSSARDALVSLEADPELRKEIQIILRRRDHSRRR